MTSRTDYATDRDTTLMMSGLTSSPSPSPLPSPPLKVNSSLAQTFNGLSGTDQRRQPPALDFSPSASAAATMLAVAHKKPTNGHSNTQTTDSSSTTSMAHAASALSRRRSYSQTGHGVPSEQTTHSDDDQQQQYEQSGAGGPDQGEMEENGEEMEGTDEEPRRMRAPHGPELVGLSKIPFQLIQVPLPWQHAVSRNEAKLLSMDQKSLLVQRPVRVMLCASPPCGPDQNGRLHLQPDNIWFVAKDIAQLLHIHEANVARRIAPFLPHERARMPVQCMQSNGTKATLMLSVLSVDGMTRLLTASKKAVMGTRLHTFLSTYINQVCASAPFYSSVVNNNTPVPSPSSNTLTLHPSVINNVDPNSALGAHIYHHQQIAPDSLIPLPPPAGSTASVTTPHQYGSNGNYLPPPLPPPIMPSNSMTSTHSSHSHTSLTPQKHKYSGNLKQESHDPNDPDATPQPSAAKKQYLPSHLAAAPAQQQSCLQAQQQQQQQHHQFQPQQQQQQQLYSLPYTPYSPAPFDPSASGWSPYPVGSPQPPMAMYPQSNQGYDIFPPTQPSGHQYFPNMMQQSPQQSHQPHQYNQYGMHTMQPPPPVYPMHQPHPMGNMNQQSMMASGGPSPISSGPPGGYHPPRCLHAFNPNCQNCCTYARFDHSNNYGRLSIPVTPPMPSHQQQQPMQHHPPSHMGPYQSSPPHHALQTPASPLTISIPSTTANSVSERSPALQTNYPGSFGSPRPNGTSAFMTAGSQSSTSTSAASVHSGLPPLAPASSTPIGLNSSLMTPATLESATPLPLLNDGHTPSSGPSSNTSSAEPIAQPNEKVHPNGTETNGVSIST